MRIGLDVGSTTLKCVVLDENDKIVYKSYERHYSQIAYRAALMLKKISELLPSQRKSSLAIAGSAGMGLAEGCGLPFVQEVFATRIAVEKLLPATDVVIELGGEDAKILFLDASMEMRMNGSCAGGTGAFIDQMATLLKLELADLDQLAGQYDKLYTIASRCGVFAKSDIQPLLNQGAKKSDIAASIFAAVVNQTVAGLAQGRKMEGNILYLGGPLSFLPNLRESFDRILAVKGLCPENSLYFVAIGAALMTDEKKFDLLQLVNTVENYQANEGYDFCSPLFNSDEEYQAFLLRHAAGSVECAEDYNYNGGVYLGVDAGSTTVKAVVIDENKRILFKRYQSNSGNPVPIIKDFLNDFYALYPAVKVKAAAVTGYGEDIIRKAFAVDFGIVETVAHFTAARHFCPEVDFIIDIGGQDIKCFKIKDGVIDNIFLNEACSSGCGSFLQTFAGAWDYDIADFAKLGLFAPKPVDLGSRCTVFMNSSVKQAQKDGATIQNISAGLSISVIKNAIYKVIRATGPEELGEHIVVQGGTFLNDAVLRAFEQEIGRNVIRPNIAGLMGAFGAALYACQYGKGQSSLLTAEQLSSFTHEVQGTVCKLCANHCRLTINKFDNGRVYIGGNRCEKPVFTDHDNEKPEYNLYSYKTQILDSYHPVSGKRGKIGIPMGLNMYELYPFWFTLLTKLGFEVVKSPHSSHALYLSGVHTISSDMVCYPAKLLHGHIEWLMKKQVDAIFYPCMTYNLDEHLGDNHYNCPVVAYYPEVLAANVPRLASEVKFIYDYVSLNNEKVFTKRMHQVLNREFGSFKLSEVKQAVKDAYAEYHSYMEAVRQKGEEYIKMAEEENLPIIILAGRPYHLDREVNHGIDKLICQIGAVVISEDAVSHKIGRFPLKVLNQWTYHARLYAAARYVVESKNPQLNLVQLVSFGCGVDAVTTDETRRILEEGGRIYTQIKIDEISNLGAVKIRLRSLFAALKQSQMEVNADE